MNQQLKVSLTALGHTFIDLGLHVQPVMPGLGAGLSAMFGELNRLVTHIELTEGTAILEGRSPAALAVRAMARMQGNPLPDLSYRPLTVGDDDEELVSNNGYQNLTTELRDIRDRLNWLRLAKQLPVDNYDNGAFVFKAVQLIDTARPELGPLFTTTLRMNQGYLSAVEVTSELEETTLELKAGVGVKWLTELLLWTYKDVPEAVAPAPLPDFLPLVNIPTTEGPEWTYEHPAGLCTFNFRVLLDPLEKDPDGQIAFKFDQNLESLQNFTGVPLLARGVSHKASYTDGYYKVSELQPLFAQALYELLASKLL